MLELVFSAITSARISARISANPGYEQRRALCTLFGALLSTVNTMGSGWLGGSVSYAYCSKPPSSLLYSELFLLRLFLVILTTWDIWSCLAVAAWYVVT